MSSQSMRNPATFSEVDHPSEIDLPTKPGLYWFQRDAMSKEIMLEVRLTNGALTVWWPNEDQPIVNLNGRWRGPILPSSGPRSR